MTYTNKELLAVLCAALAVGIAQLLFVVYAHATGRPELWSELALLSGFVLYGVIFVRLVHKRRTAREHSSAKPI